MKSISSLLSVTFLILVFQTAAAARTWTSGDGRTIDAVFVRATDKDVTIRRDSDGRVFTLPLAKLSEEDQEFVIKARTTQKDTAAPPVEPKGPYATKMTGKWEKMEFDRNLPYQIFGPEKLAAGTSYPLVIYLHGAGERGSDNEQQIVSGPKSFVRADNYLKRPCIVIAPQCPENQHWTGASGDSVIKLVKKVIKSLPIDKNRVYLTGYSMGAYGTWSALAEENRLFAAAVPIAGGGDPGAARRMKKVAIWVFHGDKDETVSVDGSRKMVEALKRVRGNVRYTEMEGEGHGIPGKVYRDAAVHEWLFEQRKKG